MGDPLDDLLNDLSAYANKTTPKITERGLSPPPQRPPPARPTVNITVTASTLTAPSPPLSPSVSRGPPPAPPPRTASMSLQYVVFTPVHADQRAADGIQRVTNTIAALRFVDDGASAASNYSASSTSYSLPPPTLSPNATGPTCARCSMTIVGEWLNMDGKTFHPNHLLCDSCGNPLGTRQYTEKHGKVICETCTSRNASFCSDCSLPIVSGERTQAMGLHFHRDHFRCSVCRAPLSEFFERDGKAFCPADFYRRHGRQCSSCNQPIGQLRSLRAFDKDWHTQCFRCCGCSREIGTGPFYPDNGRPRCSSCGPR